MTPSDKYQVINGVSYKKDTNEDVIRILEEVRKQGVRISILYGDCKTGKPWKHSKWVSGYVGHGSSVDKLPVLLFNKRAVGGQCIMDTSIVEIKEDKTNKTLYTCKTDKVDDALVVEEKLEPQILTQNNNSSL